ncbi:MAG TPA: adenylate/guanylate cyclase domain-containing protein [Acidimicrobiia bacterium]
MARSRHSAWFKPLIAVAIAVAITFGSWFALSANLFFRTQLRFSDGLFPGTGIDTRIVVVAIDDQSIARVGRWPWDRSVHADLIDAMVADGANLVGYDVTFASPNTADPAGDQRLAEAIAAAGNVVMGENTIAAGSGDPPVASEVFPPLDIFLAGLSGVGHTNTFPDTDGVVRALPPVIEGPEGELIAALSFSLAQHATGQSGAVTIRPQSVQVGGLVVQTAGPHLLEINYAAGFPTVPAVDVLEGTFAPGTFEGKIALVGATALGLGDLVATPLDKASRQPGVEVHANALNTILTGNYISSEPTTATLVWVFLISMMVAFATLYYRPWLSVIGALLILVGYFALVFRQFDSGTVMNMVYPPLALPLAYVSALGVRYFTEVRERKYVTNVFGRYLAKDVVDEVLSSPEGAVATLSGASRPLAVLFADLRGFTAASEHAAPTAVVNALNEYLEAMTRAVVEEQGTVDKFMGDCVMAFWGAPRVDPDMVIRSVRAGMKMLDYVDDAVTHGSAGELRVKGCGVGLSFGEAVVGNIGSNERLDYTAIGDTVNTASRVCGVAGGGEIVVTAEFAEALPPDEFRLAPLPPLKVKGKTELLRVVQVLREGQEPKVFEEGAFTDASEEKGAFQASDKGKPKQEEEQTQDAPPKVAGYAPVEPRDAESEAAEEKAEAGTE